MPPGDGRETPAAAKVPAGSALSAELYQVPLAQPAKKAVCPNKHSGMGSHVTLLETLQKGGENRVLGDLEFIPF